MESESLDSRVDSYLRLYPQVTIESIPTGQLLKGNGRCTLRHMEDIDEKAERRRQRLIELKNIKCDGVAAELARKIGKKPDYVNRMLSAPGTPGKKRIGEDMVEMIEAALNVPGWFDKNQSTTIPQDSRLERFTIDRLAAKGSMGPGYDLADGDRVVERMTLGVEWIKHATNGVSSMQNLRVISAYGDSMMPTLNDGDLILVDTGVKVVEINGIFVLRANNRLYIKRVRQRMDSTFEVKSDNVLDGLPEELTGKFKVEVLGRVVYAWNGKKL